MNSNIHEKDHTVNKTLAFYFYLIFYINLNDLHFNKSSLDKQNLSCNKRLREFQTNKQLYGHADCLDVHLHLKICKQIDIQQ